MTKKDFIRHFWITLTLGLLFRFLSSYFVFGPQALDDYLNQLIPSFKYFTSGVHDLPPWRSPLIIWFFSSLFSFFKFLGIHNPVTQVQGLYFFLGVFSLTATVGCYYFFEALGKYEIGVTALYFTAIHGLMPFVGTRAFLESIAMGPLTLGVGLLIWSVFLEKRKALVAALLCVGFATLIRFQVGLIYVAIVLWLMILQPRWWKEVFSVSFILLLVTALIDKIDGRAVFSTLIAYLGVNKDVANYGVQPWYSTWLAWLLVGFFPFSFPLLSKWKVLKQRGFREVAIFVLFFVLVHSLISHKEERFMYPVFGISLWLWAALWVESKGTKSFVRFVRPTILFLNFLVLTICCFFNTQVGEIGVPARLSGTESRVLFIDRESLVGKGEMWEFFIRPGSLLTRKNSPLTANEVWSQFQESPFDSLVVMTSRQSILPELELINATSQNEFVCSKTLEESSFIDSVIYRLNPKHNERRTPTWYIVCSKQEWLKKHKFALKGQ